MLGGVMMEVLHRQSSSPNELPIAARILRNETEQKSALVCTAAFTRAILRMFFGILTGKRLLIDCKAK